LDVEIGGIPARYGAESADVISLFEPGSIGLYKSLGLPNRDELGGKWPKLV
jgi:hypothetical protein